MSNRNSRILFCTALGLAAVLAPAAAADHPERRLSCAQTQSIYDWKPVDSSGVIVTTPAKQYRVTFASRCRHMKWSVFASVTTHPTGPVPCLSPGDIFVFGRGPAQPNGGYEEEERCTVRSVVALPSAAAPTTPHR